MSPKTGLDGLHYVSKTTLLWHTITSTLINRS